MKNPTPIRPPGWAIRILHWYCRPELAEDLEGDLNEYFYRNITLKGIRRARLIYFLDVLKFLRSYTVRKFNVINFLTQWIMFSSYIKISGRMILRNRLFSTINIVGLGVSMAIGLLLISMLTDMSKYDTFHEHSERIYRVVSKYKYLDREDPDHYASTSLRVGKAIRESVPGVENITVLYGGFSGDMKGGEKTVPLSGFWADKSLFEVFSFAGRNFAPRPDSATESEVIVNEKAVNRFNIGGGDPLKAVGEMLIVDRKPMQIIGVIKDFHYGRSTDPEKKEVIFRYAPAKAEYINAKIDVTDWPATFLKIENAWKKIDDVHPLEATFYDEQIAQSYGDFSSRLKVIGSLAFLAICIASIGLLGMVVFTTETRLKEISIRKVLGASEGSLVYLLSKTFLILLAGATFIALPSTHFFFVKFVLDDYADGASLPWYELMVGVLTVITTAFLMIGSHTLKVVRTNPAEVLKNE